MEAQQFDSIIRQTSRAASRRAAARLLIFGVAASLGLAGSRSAAAADVEAEAFGFCTFPKKPCKRDTQCCSHKCLNGQCTCKKKGARCFSAVGIVCCSRRCKKGKCK